MAFVGLWGYSNLLYHHMRAPSTRIIRYPFHAGLLRPNPSLPTVSRGFVSRSNLTPPTQLDRRGRTWHQFHQFQHVLLFAVPPIKRWVGYMHAAFPVSSLVFGFDSIAQLIVFPGI
jgi:hypothetical protein